MISASEREAAYAIDRLMHNDVIKSDIHSTDAHDYSEILFGALLLGFSFAARMKTLKHQQLYGFRKRREYQEQGYELFPDGYIKESLIEAQRDEMLRFIATIKLKASSLLDLEVRVEPTAPQRHRLSRVPASEQVFLRLRGEPRDHGASRRREGEIYTSKP